MLWIDFGENSLREIPYSSILSASLNRSNLFLWLIKFEAPSSVKITFKGSFNINFLPDAHIHYYPSIKATWKTTFQSDFLYSPIAMRDRTIVFTIRLKAELYTIITDLKELRLWIPLRSQARDFFRKNRSAYPANPLDFPDGRCQKSSKWLPRRFSVSVRSIFIAFIKTRHLLYYIPLLCYLQCEHFIL